MAITEAVSTKRVSFLEDENVVKIPGRNAISREERESIAFSAQDLMLMRKRDRLLARELSLYGTLFSNHDDALGLISREDRSQRKKRVVDGVFSVMLEQELCGESDVESIADVYSRCASESRLEAHQRGLMNAMQVDKLLCENHVLISNFDEVFEAASKLPQPAPFRWSNEISDSALVPVLQDAISRNAPQFGMGGLLPMSRDLSSSRSARE